MTEAGTSPRLVRQAVRPAMWWWERVMQGAAPRPVYTDEGIKELQAEWEEQDPRVQQLRLEMLQHELAVTDSNMNAQFAKLGSITTLLAFVFGFLGFAAAGTSKSIAAVMVFLAAVTALWAMSPRFKIFRYRSQVDPAERMAKIDSDWHRYWYTYEWLVRKTSTTNAIEVLVWISCRMCALAIGSVVYVLIVSKSQVNP